MTPDLMVHILEVVVIVGLAFIVVTACKTINDMNYLCDRLDRRIDFIKELEKKYRQIEERRIALTKEAAEGIKKAIDKKTTLELVEPLDFPNDEKE